MTEAAASRDRGRVVRVAIWLAAVGLLALLLGRIGIGGVVAAVRSIDASDLLLAVLLGVAGLLLSACELAEVYRYSGGSRPGRVALAREAAEVVLMNLAVPLSGSVRRAAIVRRRTGAAGRFVTGLLIQNAVVLTVAAILVASALGVDRGPWTVAGPATVVLVAVAAGSRRVGAGVARLVVGVAPAAVGRVLLVAARLGVLVGATGGRGRPGPSDAIGLVGTAGAAVLSVLVPLIPGGVGLREFLIIRSADWLGVSAPQAAAIALADRGVALAAAIVVLVAAGATIHSTGSADRRRPRQAD